MKAMKKNKDTMRGIEVLKTGFITDYSVEWNERRIIGYLKKGMTLEDWMRNRTFYRAKKTERNILLKRLIYLGKLVHGGAETEEETSRYRDECEAVERELDKLMTVKR